ncbi:GNAT family N-acetyltransferase [Bacillus thuringiensis]|uniref:GNAT family N-acetyltransferase n=1 Tax=Bacillus thuringiensis TaxID=1428 RepID=UPI0011A55326|nr:GNAT family N-acetyltransferase [Bacillus thuringiensis]
MKNSNFEENNLLIREITENDIELIRSWRNQADIRKFFTNNNYINENQQKEWYRKYLNRKDDLMFIIEETSNFQAAIGTVALYNIDKNEKTAEFGRLMIGHLPSMGNGFGKQSAILACKYAFEILNISQLYLYVLSGNTKAMQLYLDIGFSVELTYPNEIYMVLNKTNFIHRQEK